MKIVKESLNEGQRLKPWHYTEDEIFDVAYNLMMNGYLEGWEAADIKSALLYADGETIGDAPYIFTMDEEDKWDDELDESLTDEEDEDDEWDDEFDGEAINLDSIVDNFADNPAKIVTLEKNISDEFNFTSETFDDGVPVLKCFYREPDYDHFSLNKGKKGIYIVGGDFVYFPVKEGWIEVEVDYLVDNGCLSSSEMGRENNDYDEDDDYDESLKFVDNRKNSILHGDDDPGFDEYDLDYDEPLNENRSRFKSWTDAYTEFMKIVDKYFPDEDRIETEIENLNLKYGGNDRNFDKAYRRWRENWDSRNEDNYDDFDESLNENMGNMDRVIKSKVASPVTSIPPTMTDAIEKNKEIEKKIKDIEKDQAKVFSNERNFLGANNQPTPEKVKNPKPLTLDESIFSESSFDSKSLEEQAAIIHDYLDDFIISVSNDLDDNDFKALNHTLEVLNRYSEEDEDDDWLDEAVKKGSTLKRKSTLPREKDKEGKWDAWTTVMEELVPSSPSTMSVLSKVTKFPDVKRKKRYDSDAVAVDYDGNVEIYADSVDKFDFAKKVADAYNLKVDEPRPRIRGNGFTMKIYMPEAE